MKDHIKQELTDIIYDTLFENKQYDQFNQLQIDNQQVDSNIDFDVTIEDTIYSVSITLNITGKRFYLDEE